MSKKVCILLGAFFALISQTFALRGRNSSTRPDKAAFHYLTRSKNAKRIEFNVFGKRFASSYLTENLDENSPGATISTDKYIIMIPGYVLVKLQWEIQHWSRFNMRTSTPEGVRLECYAANDIELKYELKDISTKLSLSIIPGFTGWTIQIK